MKSFFKKHFLFLILLLAVLLRFYGLNWDQGHHLHPDERMITIVTTRLQFPDQLNPEFFAYGSLPIYLLKFLGWLFSFLDPKWAQYSHINLIGRGISVVFDLGTVYLIYLIAKKLWGQKTAFTASLFYTLAVFPIQAAHFYAVDTLLTFFILAVLYFLIKISNSKSLFLLTGLFFGFALATKVSAILLIVPIALTLFRQPKKLILVLIIGLFTFLVCQPYAYLDFQTFWQQTQQQSQMTKSAFTFPYTLQYVDTLPYLYHLKNLVLWGLGIPLGLISIVATLWIIIRRCKGTVILLSFFLIYFAITGRFAVKFMRYFLPLYPLLCLFSARFFQTFIKFSLTKFILMLTLASTMLWAFAFTQIYTRPNTRVLATRWINQNLPPGSKIAVEHWDDRVPLAGNYQFLEMPLYEPDNSLLKWQKINQNLAQADYLILASNRLYVPLQKLSDCQLYSRCYPQTAKYYQDLFNGKLGFTQIAEFTSYPIINDDSADESFTVYDHPKIMIFKKISLPVSIFPGSRVPGVILQTGL